MTTVAARKAGPREWAGLAVLALPTALLGLDVTVLYLTMPSLAADLAPTGTQVLWIMDAYGFLIAGFLITMGTLGDRIGRRRLLLIGAVAFGLVSIVAACSTSAEMLIATRAALGIAGATLMPSTLALVSNMFADAGQRALAIGIWVTAFAMGMAAGPVVGGLLVEHYWWGAAFLVAVPIVLVLLIAAPLLLPEYRAPGTGRFDLPSVALSLLMILPLIYAMKHFAHEGLDAATVIALVAGIGFLVVFIRRQRRLTDPLVDVSLFAGRTYTAALAVLTIGLIGVGGVMLLVTQYLQLIASLPPLEAGAWMGPPALMMFLAAIATPLIARRIRPGFVVAGTLLISSAGYLLLAQVSTTAEVLPVVLGFGLVYLGLGTIAALGTDLVVGAAPPEKAGAASAMTEMVQELGLAIGVAVLGSLATATYRTEITARLPEGLSSTVVDTVRDSVSGAHSVAGQIQPELLQQAKEAAISGLNLATVVAGAGIVLLAVLAAVVLRHIGRLGSAGYSGPHRE
ncbi:MFS transporter [Crossiella cryophila]|uniref:DHA2 family multidrug resistance protein-like MFS transporter n=1 Tax=Crossiella cryophila TaxID=43355 RepID=A0A7W7CCF6_9PSEU|nr:MFS transporter [Crossiella cryophila]MBB4678625.1 DHA2 family multidrug resistance protein-like MFS transporter [Crossiella cryophila]